MTSYAAAPPNSPVPGEKVMNADRWCIADEYGRESVGNVIVILATNA
ncbi:hypothetical protein [Rhodococcus wratislaviensis]|nr:hypothetical protein [Rhodococcus wratislaviensis]